jgi:hypothetical protein
MLTMDVEMQRALQLHFQSYACGNKHCDCTFTCATSTATVLHVTVTVTDYQKLYVCNKHCNCTSRHGLWVCLSCLCWFLLWCMRLCVCLCFYVCVCVCVCVCDCQLSRMFNSIHAHTHKHKSTILLSQKKHKKHSRSGVLKSKFWSSISAPFSANHLITAQ